MGKLFDNYGRPIKVLGGRDCPGDKFDSYGRPLIVPVLESELTDDHSFSGMQAEGTGGEDLAIFEVCYLKSDGKYWKADADAVTTMPVVVMASAAISADAEGVFIKPGSFVRDDTWDWTIGGAIYASTTPGGLTQTAPSGAGDIVQVVGWAYTADIIFFNPSLDLIDAAPVNGATARTPTSDWAHDHAADLDAHIYDPFTIMIVGEYYSGFVAGTHHDWCKGANKLEAMPLHVPRDITVDRIAIDVEVAHAANDARLGIYEDDGAGAPGTLLLDAGTVDLDATGVQAIVIDQALTKGLYWLAVVTESATVKFCGLNGAAAALPLTPPYGVLTTGFHAKNCGCYGDHAYGALPDPFPAETINYYTPILGVRIASLD